MAVVLGSFKNMARFRAITRLKMKLIAKIFPVAGGGSSAPKRFAFFHTAPNIKDEYHSPPTMNADTAAARIAQKLRV
jgi:hypothetical protein